MTRPEEDSARFLALVAGEFVSVCHPVLRIAPKSHDSVLERAEALVFTSRHGVNHFSGDIAGRRIYCVGARTMEAALARGGEPVHEAPDAEHLIEHLRRNKVNDSLVHIRGQHTTGDIAPILQGDGIRIREIISYDQPANPVPRTLAEDVAGRGRVIFPVFSARSARILGTWLADIDVSGNFVAMSEAVGQELLNLGCDPIVLAREPRLQAMARAVQDQITQPRVVE